MNALKDADRRRRAGFLASLGEYRIWLILALIVVVAALVYPQFATLQNFRNVITQSVPTALLAVGVSFVLLTGEIDLSVGAAVSLTSVMIANWMGAADMMIGPVLAIVTLFGVAVGVINGLLTVRLGIPSFIVTLAMALILQSVNLVWTAGGPASDLAPAFGSFASLNFAGIPISVFILIAVGVFGWFMIARTVLGRRLLLVGGNPKAARVAGIAVGGTRQWAFILSGLCAAAAGIYFTSYVGSGQSWLGSGMELTAIAAAVIGGVDLFGGRGTAIGAIGGALLLAVIFNLLIIAGVPAAYNPVVTGVLLLAGIGLNLSADHQPPLRWLFARRKVK